MSNRGMVVAGVMSGTSADGIDVVLVRLGKTRKPHLIGHAGYAYPHRVRSAVLSAMNATSISVADLSRLNFLLGELYADAVLATQQRFRMKAQLVGCHGQTLYHQGEATSFLGRRIATTCQIGDGAIIAAHVGVPVVSDFRPADMAAGGKGAPLVPYLDYLWFRDARVGRVVQNIGGIANLTAIPAGARADQLIAFDTGPGNMVIDAVTQTLFGQAFDRNGKIASSGEVIDPVLTRILREPFFLAKPPKTAGREEFGREFVAQFLQRSRGARKQDVVATATALTARSIAEAVRRFLRTPSSRKAHFSQRRREMGHTISNKAGADFGFKELILSGGGTRNATLVAMLAEQLAPLGIVLRFSDEFGLPSEAKEAVAFALMAYETWNRRPSNVPAATGASRPAILGKISHA